MSDEMQALFEDRKALQKQLSTERKQFAEAMLVLNVFETGQDVPLLLRNAVVERRADRVQRNLTGQRTYLNDLESSVVKMKLILNGYHLDASCGCCHGPLEDSQDALCRKCSAESRSERLELVLKETQQEMERIRVAGLAVYNALLASPLPSTPLVLDEVTRAVDLGREAFGIARTAVMVARDAERYFYSGKPLTQEDIDQSCDCGVNKGGMALRPKGEHDPKCSVHRSPG